MNASRRDGAAAKLQNHSKLTALPCHRAVPGQEKITFFLCTLSDPHEPAKNFFLQTTLAHLDHHRDTTSGKFFPSLKKKR